MTTPNRLPSGYHDKVKLTDYIADPCEEPSLSTGTVADLYRETPRVAHAFHPRLGKRPSKSTPRGDIGSAVHSEILGGALTQYAPEGFADWRKDAAKEFRDGVRADGGIPLLSHQRRIVQRAAAAGLRALEQLGDGASERTMLWQMNTDPTDTTSPKVWARGRCDWMSAGPVFRPWLEAPNGVDIEIKTVDNIDRVSFVRTAIDAAYDVQHGLRRAGHHAIGGAHRTHLWLLIEIDEASVFDAAFLGVSDEMHELAARKIRHAAKLWRRCLDANDWPGYGYAPQWALPPSYAAFDLENRGIP